MVMVVETTWNVRILCETWMERAWNEGIEHDVEKIREDPGIMQSLQIVDNVALRMMLDLGAGWYRHTDVLDNMFEQWLDLLHNLEVFAFGIGFFGKRGSSNVNHMYVSEVHNAPI